MSSWALFLVLQITLQLQWLVFHMEIFPAGELQNCKKYTSYVLIIICMEILCPTWMKEICVNKLLYRTGIWHGSWWDIYGGLGGGAVWGFGRGAGEGFGRGCSMGVWEGVQEGGLGGGAGGETDMGVDGTFMGGKEGKERDRKQLPFCEKLFFFNLLTVFPTFPSCEPIH